ncbi:hypothetical protein [Streptomyces chattanoogensis]|uniref:Uncharacterized protein n=1 Tax=Streptomyces chattanoogensis TaxID=66876 RepID=A0A0N0XXY6_9ACTN|nr:hypothetical protein [Streptomyces chattanoogensis]KPC65286.1 hypothetical protein ADL29_07970 [Streptomyces chattanoogensis]
MRRFLAGALVLLTHQGETWIDATLVGAVPALAVIGVALVLVRHRFPVASVVGPAALMGVAPAAALLNPHGEPMPCGFVGVLDTKYPVVQTSAAVRGKAAFDYKYGATVGQDTSQTSGWSVGEVPDRVNGWVEGRANGGEYLGYIVYKLDFTDGSGNRKQKMALIPARVLIQAPGNSVPMTFVKRQG